MQLIGREHTCWCYHDSAVAAIRPNGALSQPNWRITRVRRERVGYVRVPRPAIRATKVRLKESKVKYTGIAVRSVTLPRRHGNSHAT